MTEISPEEMETCLKVLQNFADFPGLLHRDDRLKGLISKLYKAGKRFDHHEERWKKLQQDRQLQASTGMVQIQRDAVSALSLPPPPASLLFRTLNRPEVCYICKVGYTQVHFFYHLLCPACAEFNYRMRHLKADLTGRTALMTGGRVKIGYQTALRLLRDGARVIVTTRFPHTAARRFASESDAAEWQNRLQLYGLDLRNLPSVEEFARHLEKIEPCLDIVIHNAAQTIRRPSGFYQELTALEKAPQPLSLEARSMVRETDSRNSAVLERGASLSAAKPLVRDVLPLDALEDNEERADSRDVNSWLLKLDEVSTPELLEVQLVNSIAPFLLNSRLKPLLLRSPFARRFIVNVSAMEGQFARNKTVYHPHTNMAKAALNMMTRTSGDDYAKDGIFMTSVDTGWVTDENPAPKRTRKQEEAGFFPPLDIVDGMARIYHPIAQGIEEEETPFYGVFLKDYAPCAW